ncbi:hypothetical protein LOTGIDRAFT_230082 [Lottia gigantea]|uniref:K Homology domain-containing protein n=1 Tax=Lottia gigantea TaxID=225164 RepID=V4BGP5_LOTGI|nr:hypothetical protein LOTGIDRAFT_230082 [Lottia gigantea]ESP05047.1 hypothetical protein LOTGIDRAFT_230082 [Lottia gigantea]
MDILRPAVIWIGNRCYRKNPIKNDKGEIENEGGNYDEEEFEMEDDSCYNDEVCDPFTKIEQTESGYRVALDIPSAYFKFIIGKKGETKNRLEHETKTQIRIPKQGMEGEVVIMGRDKKGVVSAKTRIDVLVNSARNKQQFTHFLSIPVVSDAVIGGFEDFKIDVLRECDGDRGLDATIFQNPKKLHMTIGTMALLNEREINQAVVLLQQCQQDLIEPILKGKPIKLTVEGLEYMNDDPNSVDVLYAKLQGDDLDRLQNLVDRIADKFTSANIMQREYERIKLHITVMNTLMRKDPTGASVARRQPYKDRESFDATSVLKKFGNYKFGVHHFNTLHISNRSAVGQNGYYEPTAFIRLP